MKDMDLREAAIKYLRDGHTYRNTAKIFDVNTVTLENWMRLLKETGSLRPRPTVHPPRKVFPDRLKAYVQEHCEATLKEMAAVFGCCPIAVGNALRKMGYSFKKNAVLPRPLARKARGVHGSDEPDLQTAGCLR